jgi:hypothetical protein
MAGRPVDDVRRSVDEQLKAFSAGAAQPDDLTLIAVQREA